MQCLQIVTMTPFATRGLIRAVGGRVVSEASASSRVTSCCVCPTWLLQRGRFVHSSENAWHSTRPFAEKHSAIFAARHFHAAASPLVVDCPGMGDSITEGTLNEWKQPVGAYVEEGSVLAVIETDKVSVDISAQASGQLTKVFAHAGEPVFVGKPLYELDTTAVRPPADAAAKKKSSADAEKSGVSSASGGSSPAPPSERSGGQSHAPPKSLASQEPPAAERPQSSEALAGNGVVSPDLKERIERRVPMSRMRQRIAERLKGAQNTAAMLSTFNECDMGNLMALRSEMNEAFQEKYGVKMDIENNDIVYKDYVDISVAVATPTGLMVPVVRDCQRKSWAELELDLADLAKRARANQIAIEDMAGGTFTISNGGVYGSMLGTPILNPPQASILGMHGVTKRPVVRNNEIVIRPIMYLALTYDHRLVDGREAVLFLCSIRDYIEDPRKMLLGL